MDSDLTVRSPLQSLLIGHTFLVFLIPLLVVLFYYSTPHSRRQPIFILNALSLILTLAIGIMSDAINIHVLLSPQPIRSEWLYMMIAFMGNFQMMLIDTILLVRLVTVYPLRRIGLMRFVLLTFLPTALKVVRVMNTSTFIYTTIQAVKSHSDLSPEWSYEKIEWIAQVVDNSYASFFFLWAIRRSRVDATPGGLMSVTARHESNVATRIRTLFRLALSNFIIPTAMSILQLAILFRTGTSYLFSLADLAIANNMVSAFGVVFATVWAGKEHWREAKTMPDLCPPEEHELQRIRSPDTEGSLAPASAIA